MNIPPQQQIVIALFVFLKPEGGCISVWCKELGYKHVRL
jgi:hypothetical protein